MKINRSMVEVEMAKQKLSYVALCERGGISRLGLRYALQRGECTVAYAGKIADALGVPVERIVEKEER